MKNRISFISSFFSKTFACRLFEISSSLKSQKHQKVPQKFRKTFHILKTVTPFVHFIDSLKSLGLR